MVRLLKSLPRYRLPFPLSLMHDDKPDFHLSADGVVIGIEAVEAVSEVDAHRDHVIGSLIAAGNLESPLQSVALRSPWDAVQSRAQASIPDRAPHFYEGDEVETNWVSAMKFFIDDKIQKFPTYTVTQERWLLVYDNWPSVVLDLHEGIERLQKFLVRDNVFSTLNSLYILRANEIVEFGRDGFKMFPLRSPKPYLRQREGRFAEDTKREP